MQANVGYNRLRIKDTSTKVFVPNNDIARLMYYLECVFTVLKCNKYSEYTDFNNYYSLSNSDINELIKLVKIFDPKIMIGAKVFVLEEDLVMDNKFIEITDETMNIHLNEEIVIGGIVTKVSQKMLFTSQWILNNYYNPLKRLTQRIYYPPILPPPPILSPPPVLPLNPPPVYGSPYNFNGNYNYNYSANDSEELCCCTIF